MHDVDGGLEWLHELQAASGPPWHSVGLRPLHEEAWLVADDERDEQLELKRSLLEAAPGEVSLHSPEAAPASGEAAGLVGRSAGRVLDPDRPPLEAAALTVQEDLCVLLRHGGHWRLAAGVVCFPSMWRLRDKLGSPIATVHAPVPYYDEELADRVDRVLDRIAPGRALWRRNWFVHTTRALHLPDPPPAPDALRVPEDLWLRSERQTLLRLPRTGAILFTIRTQHAPLAAVAALPELAAAMAASVRSWPDDLVAYRGAAPWRVDAARWLEDAATNWR